MTIDPAFWQNTVRILALDPSLDCIGWALFDGKMLTSWGRIWPQGDDLDAQLADAACRVGELLRGAGGGGVNVLALEMPIYIQNAKTTIKLAQLAGAIRFVAWGYVDRVIEIQPQQRKTALGLPNKANKQAVITLINGIYGRELTKNEHDIADAVAVGHAAIVKMKMEGWAHDH